MYKLAFFTSPIFEDTGGLMDRCGLRDRKVKSKIVGVSYFLWEYLL